MSSLVELFARYVEAWYLWQDALLESGVYDVKQQDVKSKPRQRGKSAGRLPTAPV